METVETTVTFTPIAHFDRCAGIRESPRHLEWKGNHLCEVWYDVPYTLEDCTIYKASKTVSDKGWEEST